MLEKEKRTDDIKAEFELREKRLKLVYKILYVAVALWAALFVAYTSAGNNVFPLYCGFLSALTAAILNIIYYIFGELRCMKIYTPAADESKVEADSKFVEIWNSFGLGVSISALLTLIHKRHHLKVVFRLLCYLHATIQRYHHRGYCANLQDDTTLLLFASQYL